MPGIQVLRANEQVPELSYRASRDAASADRLRWRAWSER